MVYYNAFMSLSQARPAGGMGGSAAIPVSEVLAYCVLWGIANRREKVKYLTLVQELDQIYLTHWAEAQDKKTK